MINQSEKIETVESNDLPLKLDKISNSNKDTKTPLEIFFIKTVSNDVSDSTQKKVTFATDVKDKCFVLEKDLKTENSTSKPFKNRSCFICWKKCHTLG